MTERWHVGETRFLGLPRRRGILMGVISLLVITALVAGVVAWVGANGISLALATLVGVSIAVLLGLGQWLGFASVLAESPREDEP